MNINIYINITFKKEKRSGGIARPTVVHYLLKRILFRKVRKGRRQIIVTGIGVISISLEFRKSSCHSSA
jgi:hypothetical protein